MNKKLLAITALSFAFIGIISAQIDQSKVSLYLPFNGSIADQSGKNVTVAQSTITPGNVTYVSGKFGQAAAFNSTPLVTTGVDFVSNQDFTICAWVYLAVLPADPLINAGQRIIQQMDITGPDSIVPGRIHLQAALGGYFSSNTSAINCDDPGLFSANRWYFVAHVQDAVNNTRYLYVDGVLVATTTPIGTESNNGELVIGGGNTEKGKTMLKQNQALDDLFFTRQALDATTIASIYANGVSFLLANVNTPKTSALSSYNYKNDQLSLQLSAALQSAKVEIFNIAGQKVFNELTNSNLNTFNIPLNKGIYILKVTAGNYNSSVKFTVK